MTTLLTRIKHLFTRQSASAIQPAKSARTTTMFNTQDRITEIEHRLQILQKMIEELTTKPGRYSGVGWSHNVMNQVHQNIRVEQIQLAAERNVLIDLQKVKQNGEF